MELTEKSSQPHYYVFIYSALIFFCSLLVLILAGELLVRLLVPKEFYLPINNIYQAVNTDYGYTYKPNFNGTAFGVRLKTNSLGFRGLEWSIEKKNNTVRIALIGDSHAFGYGVPFEDTVGEKLSALLSKQGNKKYEVLNFGVASYNSRQELAVFLTDALKFNPDILVVIPCSNDHKEALIADTQGYLRTATNSDVKDESIDKLSITTASWFIEKSRMVFYLLFLKKQYQLSREINKLHDYDGENFANGNNWWMGPFPPMPISEQLQKNVYEPLKDMISEAKNRHMQVVIANFNAIPVYRQLFANLSQEEDVPSIELLALFPEANSWEELLKKFGLGWNNHLNAVAHERWAQAICQLLIDTKK